MHRHRGQRLVQNRIAATQQPGLADDMQRYVDRHLNAQVDRQEVDVLDRAGDRVALQGVNECRHARLPRNSQIDQAGAPGATIGVAECSRIQLYGKWTYALTIDGSWK